MNDFMMLYSCEEAYSDVQYKALEAQDKYLWPCIGVTPAAEVVNKAKAIDTDLEPLIKSDRIRVGWSARLKPFKLGFDGARLLQEGAPRSTTSMTRLPWKATARKLIAPTRLGHTFPSILRKLSFVLDRMECECVV